MKVLRILLITALVIGGITLQAQVFSENLTPTASLTGTAGSIVASSGTQDGWLLNPALLVHETNYSFNASFQQLFGRSFLPYYAANFVTPLWKISTGWQIQSLGVDYGGNTLSKETMLGISQAVELLRDPFSSLAVGWQIALYQVDYGHSAGTQGDGSDGMDLGADRAVGVSFGVEAGLGQWVSLGARVQNLNRPRLGVQAEDLPRTLQVGVALKPYPEVETQLGLLSALGHPLQFHGAFSYRVRPFLKLFTGVQTEPNRWGVGFTLSWRHLRFTYGLLTHPVLPLTQAFGLSWQGL